MKDREPCCAAVHGAPKKGNDLASEQQQQLEITWGFMTLDLEISSIAADEETQTKQCVLSQLYSFLFI